MDLKQGCHIMLPIRYATVWLFSFDIYGSTHYYVIIMALSFMKGTCRAELSFDFTYLRDFMLILPDDSKLACWNAIIWRDLYSHCIG